MIRFIDLFAGIGGFHLGLSNVSTRQFQSQSGATKDSKTPSKQDSAEPTSSRRTNTGKFCCVYANEWDKYANQIYKKHFGECDQRDIRTVPADSIPNHDLLCAGFPCQSFSIAGKRRGFNDTRGTLFFDIVRILNAKRPRLCLLENVKGLLSHDQGRTFKTIISTLVELGYDIQWQVVNSKNFGVPQNRERVFIIGHLRGTPRPKVFPIGESSQILNQEKRGQPENGKGIRSEISSTIDTRYGALRNVGETYIKTKHLGQAIRRLTPIECERLQGFPDNWTEGISDTQRYKCLGNAVTVNVIEYLGKLLLALNESSR